MEVSGNGEMHLQPVEVNGNAEIHLQLVEVNGNAEMHLQLVEETRSSAGLKEGCESHGNLILDVRGRDLQSSGEACAGAGLLEGPRLVEKDPDRSSL
ncbi:hypothetical protein HGM15179_015122 [Zosterops borbonicus]|uniref:Uncharacterized protein n=1 Tax=Zosterops borbonicus TaxID=364589 RepID=A0A8K1G592_9PASS|nr:hypothetical protein HGM15179_015122 [Zosterops borbonicus]